MDEIPAAQNVAKGNKRKVFIKANFLKVSEINTIKEEFIADVYIQARWREPTLDQSKEGAGVDYTKYWNPKIVINNTSADVKTTRAVRHGKSGEAYIVEKRRIKGVFAENLELHEFPFDIQDLSVVVSSEHSEDAIQIVEDDEEISAVNVSCFVDETEWTIMDLVYTEPRSVAKEFSESQFKNPALFVKCVAKRRAGFFMYNIILIMTMITTLSFTTFGVDQSLTQNRLQLAFIILLTGVTFKLVTNQSLPKIPYLTHLDRYILGSMGLNWLVCVWHAVLSRWDGDSSTQDTMDKWAFIILIILYAIFQIVFYLLVLVKRLRRGFHFDRWQTAYQEKAVRLMGSTWKSDRNARKAAVSRRMGRIGAVGQVRSN